MAATPRVPPRSEEVRGHLAEYLKERRWATIRERCEEAAQQAVQESLGYESSLLDFVQREAEVRQHRRIERVLRASDLPLEKTLETFELSRLSPKVVQQVNRVRQGFFVDTHENVLAFGNPGSGTTHLVCGIAQELVRQGRRIWLSTCALFVQKLRVAKRDLVLPQVLKTLGNFDGMLIDDIGYVQHNREEMAVLFTLRAERYDQGSLLMTSHLAFSQWDKIFKDPMTTVAAIDRVVHHSVIVELNSPSSRMEQAQQRTGKAGDWEKERGSDGGTKAPQASPT